MTYLASAIRKGDLMHLTEQDLHRMIDFTLLHNVDSEADVREFAQKTIAGNYAAAFIMPSYTALMANLLKDHPDIHVGGAIAFPTGAEPTEVKLAMVDYHLGAGAKEFDFVQNLGFVKSGRYDLLLEEDKKIVAAAKGNIVKCILEVTCLTDEEIAKSAQVAVEAGCTFVKTGTGTMPNPTTVHHVEVIRQAVGDQIKIKAAGGIRDWDTMLAMIRLGVSRFGISWGSALKILDEFKAVCPDGIDI